MMTNLANISTNKDMTAENKTIALNNGMSMLNDALGMLGQINSLNLGTTLVFNRAAADIPPPVEDTPVTSDNDYSYVGGNGGDD